MTTGHEPLVARVQDRVKHRLVQQKVPLSTRRPRSPPRADELLCARMCVCVCVCACVCVCVCRPHAYHPLRDDDVNLAHRQDRLLHLGPARTDGKHVRHSHTRLRGGLRTEEWSLGQTGRSRPRGHAPARQSWPHRSQSPKHHPTISPAVSPSPERHRVERACLPGGRRHAPQTWTERPYRSQCLAPPNCSNRRQVPPPNTHIHTHALHRERRYVGLGLQRTCAPMRPTRTQRGTAQATVTAVPCP
jgi:hypothetical protein